MSMSYILSYLLQPRIAVAAISILNMGVCIVDIMSSDDGCQKDCCSSREHVESLRFLLAMFFQVANMLLLLAAVNGSALLIDLYIFYTLGFTVVSIATSILTFIFKIRHERWWSFIHLIPDVLYLFVLCQCLPFLYYYKKDLEDAHTLITNNK